MGESMSGFAELLVTPAIAFLVCFLLYVLLVGILSAGGRLISGATRASAPYASGEADTADRKALSPGYRPFFLTALFFAIVHLGALMLGSGVSAVSAVYAVGLIMVLWVLLKG
jgi:hypothetical protein